MKEAPPCDKLNIEWFSQAADYYKEVYGSSSPVARFLNERIAKVIRLLDVPDGRLLDVGCGIGMLFRRLGPESYQFFGIDISHNMLAYCRKGAGAVKPVNVTQSNLEYLPFTDEAFDTVVALGVLEYLPHARVGIEEIARVTKANGTVILSMHNKYSLYRCWERSIYQTMTTVRSRLAGVRRRPPVLRLQTPKALSQLMANSHLKPVAVTYYDFNVFLPPLDERYPRRAQLINSRIEKLFGNSWSKLFSTGFLVKAQKVSHNEQAMASNSRK